MQNLTAMNSKEIKELLLKIKEQWDADLKKDAEKYAFLQNAEDKIFIANKELFSIDLSKIRINSLGVYFAQYDKMGLRLSIEGSQLIGKYAKKNITEIDDKQAKEWMNGEDLFVGAEKELKGFVIVKRSNDSDDFLGSGKYQKETGRIFNFVPKARRVKAI